MQKSFSKYNFLKKKKQEKSEKDTIQLSSPVKFKKMNSLVINKLKTKKNTQQKSKFQSTEKIGLKTIKSTNQINTLNVNLKKYLATSQNQKMLQSNYFNTLTKNMKQEKIKNMNIKGKNENSKQKNKQAFLDFILPSKQQSKLIKNNSNISMEKSFNKNVFKNFIDSDLSGQSLRNSTSNETYKMFGRKNPLQIQKTETTPKNKLEVILVGNWGHKRQIGLTQIQLFDAKYRQYKLCSKEVFLQVNHQIKENTQLKRIYNNQVMTNSELNMLILPKFNHNAIIFELDSSFELEFLLIWNYNGLHLSKGVRECKIIYDDEEIFEGIINQGNGLDSYYNYFTIINKNRDFQVKQQQLHQIMLKRYAPQRKSTPLMRNIKFKQTQEDKKVNNQLIVKNVSIKKVRKIHVEQKKITLKKKKSEKIIKFSTKKGSLKSLKNNSLKMIPSTNDEKSNNSLKLSKSKKNLKSPFSPQSNPQFNFSRKKTGDILEFNNRNIQDSFNVFTDEGNFNQKDLKLMHKKQETLQKIYLELEDKQIQELPLVDGVEILILENWGCEDFIAINGIEFFDKAGQKIELEINSIKIKIQEDSKTKHSKPVRLLNKDLITNDMNKIWLIRRCDFELPKILIEFPYQANLSMIRVWNQNSSRLVTNQGVRTILIREIYNKQILFFGEIKKASGDNNNSSKYNFESILFTIDDKIFNKLAKNDWYLKRLLEERENNKAFMQKIQQQLEERPKTSEKSIKEIMPEVIEKLENRKLDYIPENHESESFSEEDSFDSYSEKSISFEEEIIECQLLQIQVMELWSTCTEYGFKEIIFYNEGGQRISNEKYSFLSSNRIFDNTPETMDKNLKLGKTVYFALNQTFKNILTIQFHSKQKIKALKIHPLSEKGKECLRSPKQIHIFADGNKISGQDGVFLKKSSNSQMIVHSQIINFPVIYSSSFLKQPKTGNWLNGLVLEFHLKKSFQDLHYIGLNEIQIYDLNGKNVLQEKNNLKNSFQISAFPPGLFIDSEMQKDVRRIQNLVNGQCQSKKYEDIWLTFKSNPLLSKQKNVILIEFQKPITIALINIYNYFKNPERGVKEIEIYLDNYLIYSGHLNNPKIESLSSIFFSQFLRSTQIQTRAITFDEDEDIEMINEHKIEKKRKIFSQMGRPFTGKFDDQFNQNSQQL